MTNGGAKIAIRPMRRREMDWAVECAAGEGWNPGLHDASCFFGTDPGGFLIGTLDGIPIGCISAVSYASGFGFIGFYMLVPEFRGKGYGLRLWGAAMERLKRHNIGLDGVVEQQQNYRKSGFRFAYRNIRFEATSVGAPDGKHELLLLDDVPRRLLEQYDLRCFPAPRKWFLAGWLSMPHSLGVGCMEDGALAGYGVMRRCRQGYKIGPLFADDADKAEAIFLFLASFAEEGKPVCLDVPEVNEQAVKMVERRRMKKVFETARMYTGPDPKVDLSKVFGVTTFELG